MFNTETERKNKSRLWRFDGVRGKRISKRLSKRGVTPLASAMGI